MGPRLFAPLLLASCTVHAADLIGSYTELQATQGKLAYEQHCAECHHFTLRGTGHRPELAGPNFLAKWGNQSIAALNTLSAAQMPAGAPHSLKPEVYTAITAHLLRVNGAAAGEQALSAEVAMPIGVAVRGAAWDLAQAQKDAAAGSNPQFRSWSAAGSIAEAAKQASGFTNRAIKNYTPISDALLAEPPDGAG